MMPFELSGPQQLENFTLAGQRWRACTRPASGTIPSARSSRTALVHCSFSRSSSIDRPRLPASCPRCPQLQPWPERDNARGSQVQAEADLSTATGGPGGGDGTGGAGGGGGGGDSGGDKAGGSFLHWLGAWYLHLLSTHPIATKGFTAGLLNALADLFCQVAVERSGGLDLRRLGSFAAIGLCIVGPCLHFWFSILSAVVTVPGTAGVLIRLVLDQAFFSPSSIAVFFGLVLLLEGRLQELPPKLKRDMVPTVLNMWKLWIPAQFLVFAVVPPPLQVLASNLVGVVWTVYMSFASHNDVSAAHSAKAGP